MNSNETITKNPKKNNKSLLSDIPKAPLSLYWKKNNNNKMNKYNYRFKLLKYIFVLSFMLFLSQNFSSVLYLLRLGHKPIPKQHIIENIEKPLIQDSPDVKIIKDVQSIAINGKRRKSWKNVRRDFVHLLHKYKYLINNEKTILEDSPIFMMWYQGIKKAPRVVKMCFQSVFVNREKHPLILLDKHNLRRYLKLPSYIYHKFRRGRIGYAAFSDIVRTGLLTRYGGYWIDATYYINTKLKKVDTNFVSIKPRHCFMRWHPFIKCLFSINYLGVAKNSFIANFSFACLLFYWRKYNRIIDYFLLDYIFDLAYRKVPKFHRIIKRHPRTTCGIFALHRKKNRLYNPGAVSCAYNKLKKRGKYISYKNGQLTNIGYLFGKYKFNYQNYINSHKKI